MRRLAIALQLLVAVQASSAAAEPPAEPKLPLAEQELVTLMADYYAALEHYLDAGLQYVTPQVQMQAVADG